MARQFWSLSFAPRTWDHRPI